MVCRVMVVTGEDIDTRAMDDIDAIPVIEDAHIIEEGTTND